MKLPESFILSKVAQMKPALSPLEILLAKLNQFGGERNHFLSLRAGDFGGNMGKALAWSSGTTPNYSQGQRGLSINVQRGATSV